MKKDINEIILFEDENVKLEVNMQDDTVWLTQGQMVDLFKSSRSNISEHIKRIYEDSELDKNSTIRKFRTVQKEGNRNIIRNIEYYNLDMIISIGYRVNTKKGVIFRRWANKILKDYMLKGYAVNQKRLEYLEKTIKLIDIATRLDEDLRSDESYNMLKIISEYTKALETLEKYDHNEIQKPKGNINNNKKILYEDCIKLIKKMPFQKTSDIFGVERDQRIRIDNK
jgi:hypothetical protein